MCRLNLDISNYWKRCVLLLLSNIDDGDIEMIPPNLDDGRIGIFQTLHDEFDFCLCMIQNVL